MNFINYIAIHDIEIMNIHKNKQNEIDKNLLQYNKYICARNPDNTNCHQDNSIINVFEEKYQNLNEYIRGYTGILHILNNIAFMNAISKFDFAGFQSCSFINNINLDFLDKNKKTVFFVPYICLYETYIDFFKMFTGCWWNENINIIVDTFKSMSLLENDIGKFANFCLTQKYIIRIMFDFIINLKYSKDITNIFNECTYLYNKVLDFWKKQNKGIFYRSMPKTDIFDMLLTYEFNTKYKNLLCADNNIISIKYRFTDSKYHCRTK